MLQQTTVQAVVPYFVKFIKKWPTVADLAAAANDDVMQNWAGLGYYARARNLHKCAQYVANELHGVFPHDIESLKKLSGVGDYTANAIAAIAFNHPANVVDGLTEIQRRATSLDALMDSFLELAEASLERETPELCPMRELIVQAQRDFERTVRAKGFDLRGVPWLFAHIGREPRGEAQLHEMVFATGEATEAAA